MNNLKKEPRSSQFSRSTKSKKSKCEKLGAHEYEEADALDFLKRLSIKDIQNAGNLIKQINIDHIHHAGDRIKRISVEMLVTDIKASGFIDDFIEATANLFDAGIVTHTFGNIED